MILIKWDIFVYISTDMFIENFFIDTKTESWRILNAPKLSTNFKLNLKVQ